MNTANSELVDRQTGQEQGGRRFCSARTKAGRVCGSPSLKADLDGFCWAHSPTIADKRRESQRRGGATTSARRALLLGRIDFSSGEGVRSFLEALCRAAVRGELPSGRARDCASIATAALNVRRGAELEEKVSELERLIHALEEADRAAA